MHYFQFEIKEWVSNTAHLTHNEESAYLRLICYYYDSERPLPHDDLAMIFRKCRVNEDLGKSLMLEFFRMDGNLGAWVHDRCDREIAKYHAKHEQASRAGKASAESRLNSRSTPVQPINNQESSIINQESKNQKRKTTSVVMPDGISESVWHDFMTLRKTKKATLTATALKGIEREAAKANISLEQALRHCCERGWAGFKAEWIAQIQPNRISPTVEKNLAAARAISGDERRLNDVRTIDLDVKKIT